MARATSKEDKDVKERHGGNTRHGMEGVERTRQLEESRGSKEKPWSGKDAKEEGVKICACMLAHTCALCHKPKLRVFPRVIPRPTLDLSYSGCFVGCFDINRLEGLHERNNIVRLEQLRPIDDRHPHGWSPGRP